jgi:hypothetical protein
MFKDKCLTTCYHLARLSTVSFPCWKGKGSGTYRLIGAVALFFVFFLPLHLHFSTPIAQVNKECSCYYGGRTQAGLAPAQADWTPTFQASSIVLLEPQVIRWHSFDSYAIRAPPSVASL